MKRTKKEKKTAKNTRQSLSRQKKGLHQDTFASVNSFTIVQQIKQHLSKTLQGADYLFLSALSLLCLSPLVSYYHFFPQFLSSFIPKAGEFENVPKMAFLQWGIIIFALIHLWRKRGEDCFVWKRSPMNIPIVLFYLFSILSIFHAVNPYLTVLPLLHWGASIILYFLILAVIRDKTQADLFIFTASLSVVVVSVIGLLQHSFDISLIPQVFPPASTFSNRNMAAQFIALGLPLCIGSVFLSQTALAQLLAGTGIAFVSTYLIYTKTRAGWLASLFALFLMIVCFFIPRVSSAMRKCLHRTVFGFIGISIGICVVLLLNAASNKKISEKDVPAAERFLSIARIEEGSTSQLRIIWWANTLFMIKDNLLWGVGIGNFKIQYPLYHRAAGAYHHKGIINYLKHKLHIKADWTFNEEHQLNRAHNDHLQMFAEVGIFGFIMYILMFTAFFRIAWRIFFKGKNEAVIIRAVFIFLAVSGFFVNATFTFPMERAIPPAFLFALFAIMSALCSDGEPGYACSQSFIIGYPWCRVVRMVFGVLLVVFLFVSIHFIRKIMVADKYFVDGLIKERAGKIEESILSLQKAKDSFFMGNFNITGLLALNYTKQNNYQMALKEYEDTLKAHPNNINAMLNMGYCYLKLEKYDRAEAFFKRVLDIKPDFAQGYNNLGIIYSAKKKYEEAVLQYKRAIELKKSYAEPHYNLGNIYKSQGKIKEAISEYEKTIEINPSSQKPREFLAALYMEMKEYDRAQEVLQPLLQGGEESAENYVLQGNMYLRQSKYKRALEAFLKALRLTPEDAFLYHNIGLTHYYLKNYVKAERAFEKALSLNPNIAESWNLLGQLYLRRRDDRGALEKFSRALTIDPSFRDAQFNVGTIYLRLGEKQRAISAYKATLHIDPKFSLAHYNLATLYMDQGNVKDAIFHFEKALKNPSHLIDVKKTKQFIASLKKKLGN